MKVVSHALALLTCAGLAWIAAALWIFLHPIEVPEFEALGIEYDNSGSFVYIWLAVFSVLCLCWFFWTLKINHD